jgi:hypothetical protein
MERRRIGRVTATSTADLRRWAHGHATAEAWIREEKRDRVITPAAAFDELLDLLSLASTTLGWPLPADPVRQRDLDAARDTWARLRRARACDVR